MKVIRSRAPLRLGLAGGGTDVSPFSDLHGGHVLNATIDLYAHTILEPRDDGKLVLIACDREEQVVLDAHAPIVDDDPLRLHRGIHRRVVQDFNDGKPLACTVTTFADAPAGSGLGTSSTMVVSVLQAYAEWLKLDLGEYELAHLAYQIEREDLALAGGKQDQYAAAFGGFNFIEFGADGRVLVNPLRVKAWIINELEASTLLYYTGQSRESARIIQQQIDNTREAKSDSIDAMLALKEDASNMKEVILRGDLERYPGILGRSWQAKKKMAVGITTPLIEQVYDSAIEAGAHAGKISGAGGGGFMMFFVSPARRLDVVRALSPLPGELMNFHFTPYGAQSWAIG
ncbi:dehydrogenase (plasmid) [Aquabacterium olei]|uniref:Dehydrogenase n=1 Tax=Aquabacterium olei TaxID=1296669 RepID=A0A2U8FY77_9BURK|nr:dehydrogenase [Aquabacterium olei]AWI55384.1 dehydrogenase [Aquabacterium olei]